MLCSVTHNSCSVVSLKERINEVLWTGATRAVKKSVGGCVSALFPTCFRASSCIHCLTTVYVCSSVGCLCQYDEG